MSEYNNGADTREEPTSTDSPTDPKTIEPTPSAGGDNNQTQKPVPFNEDPKIQDFLDRQMASREAKLREEISKEMETRFSTFKPAAPKDESVQVPKWFGGGANTPEVQEMWREYQAEQAKITSAAEERAFQRLSTTQSAQTKAVEDANNWFNESVTAIEKEAGKPIDRNALLKITLDNELIDSKSRWNYKAAWQILKGQSAPANDRQDRKKLAGDTMDGNGADPETPKGVKTSEDFKKERPW